jgi:hypothetical protein
MDEKHANARENVFAAIRALAASTESLQTRLISANEHILLVTIDEFADDIELKIKFSRILDHLAVDQGDMEATALETVEYITDLEAIRVASLICDFFYDLG